MPSRAMPYGPSMPPSRATPSRAMPYASRQAKRDFETVLQTEPSNAGARRELQRVGRELKAELQRERQRYSKAFEKPLYGDKPDRGEVAAAGQGGAAGGEGGEGGAAQVAAEGELVDDGGLVDGEVTLSGPIGLARHLPIGTCAPFLGVGALLVGRHLSALEPPETLAVTWTPIGGTWLLGWALLGILKLAAPAALDAHTRQTATLFAWCLSFSLVGMHVFHAALWLFGWRALPTVCILSGGASLVPFVYFLQQLGGWKGIRKARALAEQHTDGSSGSPHQKAA